MRHVLVTIVALSAAIAHAQPVDGGAPPSDGGPVQTPNSDEDLRRQLRQALDLLARHEVELQQLKANALKPPPPQTQVIETQQHWYDRINIRGYTQLRYNFPGAEYNDKLINEQGDKSLGGNGGFIIRRARVIIFGDLHPRVSIYLQPDFASSISEQLGVSILRDWYADVFLDRKKEFRLRIGQSKVPFGFENLQSSQNRLPLDRNDALNSAVKDERDLGIFFYWAPDHIRRRFKFLVDSGLKGSGDYGVIGIGIYNGQTANRLELNKIPHVVARVTYPFAIGSQFLEVSAQGYYGQYTVALANQTDGTKYTSTEPDNNFHEARGALTFVLYPKPFGIQAEYNVGVGPSLSTEAPTEVRHQFLYGGYLQLMYKIDKVAHTVALIPYVRGTMYDGGKKFQTNAPQYQVKEIEMGLEWQIIRPLEVVLAYMISDRTSDKHPYLQQYGHWGRIQVQVNY
jgi:hypothetical protein